MTAMAPPLRASAADIRDAGAESARGLRTAGADRHLHFVQAVDPHFGGGLGTASLGLHGQMLASGVTSRLVTTGPRSSDISDHAFAYRRVGLTAAFFSPGMWAVASSLVREHDVVHGHGLYTAVNWCFGSQIRRRTECKLVYHPHGMFEPYILSRSRLKKTVAHWLYETANVRSAQLWRALTTTEADQIRAIVPGARVVVVPNGVRVPARAAEPTGGLRQMGYLGRLHEKKGITTLIAAWAGVEQSHPGWELVIAGPGDPDYLRQVVAAARRVPRVRIEPAITGQAKEAFLAGLSLFVLPSVSEGFPMAVLEAMAAGVPVIATDRSNAPALEAHDAGWTCASDQASITATLRRALRTDDGELREMGLSGRRLVSSEFNWDRATRTLLDACRNA
jgi:glycosyltransferase involved in cell wall biosynthesis